MRREMERIRKEIRGEIQKLEEKINKIEKSEEIERKKHGQNGETREKD